MTTRTATEGTQKHRDLATEKMNIKFYVDVHGMTRAAAKKKVDGMVQRGEKLMSAADINRAIAAAKKAERAAEARRAREAEAARKAKEAEAAKAAEEAKRAEEAAKRAEAAKKKWESDAKKGAEPEAEKTEEPKTGKTIKQGKVGVTVNDVQYASICAGMRAVGIPDKGTNNWSRIRSALKKTGQIDFTYEGSIYQFIQL